MRGKDLLILHEDVFTLEEFSKRESDRERKRKRRSRKEEGKEEKKK